jgi:hypothetical protein
MSDVPTGNVEQTVEWLSRQMHRLCLFEPDGSPHDPRDIIAKRKRRLDILKNIIRIQESISDTQTALACQRLRQTQLLSQLGRSRIDLELKKSQLNILFEKPDDFKVKEQKEGDHIVRVVTMQDPLRMERISEWNTFLAKETVQVSDELKAVKRMLAEDDAVRREEITLRDSQPQKLPFKAGNELKACVDRYLSLRYRLKELGRRKQASEGMVRLATAEASAKIHEISDRARITEEQTTKQVTRIETRMIDSLRMGEARMFSKADTIESALAQAKQEAAESRGKLVAEVEYQKRRWHHGEEARAADDHTRQVKTDIALVKVAVRRLEDTAALLKGRARDERLALRE